MNNSKLFTRGILLGLAGVVGLMAANAVLSYQNVQQLDEDAGWVIHTHEVLDALAEVQVNLRQAEAIQRTYLITGGDKIPAGLNEAIEAAKRKITRIKVLTDDNAEQQARIPDLEKRMERLAEARLQVASVRKEQGFDAARQIILSGKNNKARNELQALIGQMDQAERELLRDRQRKTNRAHANAIVTGIVTFLLGLVAVAMFVWLLERHLRTRQRAATIVHEQRQLLQATLASIGDGVIATDAEGHVTFLNEVARRLTGWLPADAVGRPLTEVFHIVNEETRKDVDNPALRALAAGKIVGLANHTILIAKDGTEWPLDDSAAPIRDQGGAITGAVLVFREVSQRRRLEKEMADRLAAHRLLASIVESSGDAIIAKTLDGTIQSWNAAAQRIFGFAAQEAVGRHISLIIPADRATEEEQIIARLRAGERIDHFETVRQRKDGRTLPVSLAISPLKDETGRVVGASKIARDITDRKRAEEALREADRRKDEFLATLAHELRNPLAPIRNGLQIMRLASDNQDALEQARAMMDRQLSQLVRLVDDLMDMSRISRGLIELRPEPVELAAVINGAVETSRPLIEQMGHKLVVSLPELPIVVNADPTRLAQVFLNLLNNAAKYTEPGGHIRLSAERFGSDTVVSVTDTGMGIAADQLPCIFAMYSQLDQSLGRSQGGLGIGLTLVKRLVELHNGSIEAKSAGPGKGSEFIVRLPVVIEASAPRLAEHKEIADLKTALRILVVDDNRDGANSLSMMLRIMGNDTRTAYDGEVAVAAAAEFRPNVILLDIGLPKLTGYEACGRIRELPGGAGIIIIAQTGWGSGDDRQRAHEAGFDHHMVKPVDMQALLKLLAGLQAAKA